MSRSAFFLAAVCSGALLLAACGGDSGGSNSSPSSATAFPTGRDPAKNIPKAELGIVNLVPAGTDFYVGQNNFVFGITNKNDEPQGGATAHVTFYDLKDPKNPKPVSEADAVEGHPGVGPITTVTHADGETHTHGGENENRVGYYVAVKFDHDGPWGVLVQATLKDGTKATTSVGFDVYAKPNIPAPGMAAYKSDNLIKTDVTNIAEIDSGTPPDDMHDVKIKDAIAAGRPLVILFATPAFCTSRFCGPVEQEVESMQATYKDKVDFVHIEIWRNFDQQLLNPTAKEWLLWPNGEVHEPVVYVVDKSGVIYNRWEGPVSKNIMEDSVKAVAGGATFVAGTGVAGK